MSAMKLIGRRNATIGGAGTWRGRALALAGRGNGCGPTRPVSRLREALTLGCTFVAAFMLALSAGFLVQLIRGPQPM